MLMGAVCTDFHDTLREGEREKQGMWDRTVPGWVGGTLWMSFLADKDMKLKPF